MRDKRIAAQTLYNEGFQQQQISDMLGISQTTISKWKKVDGWEERLRAEKTMEQTNEDIIKRLINHQLMAIEEAINQPYEDGKRRLISKGEIDALSKMYATIKKKDIVWTTYVKISQELITYLQAENLPLAKKIIPLIHDFLNNKQEQL